MEQNKQYLYEYRNGKRVRNIGFMKIEKQMDKCLIQIYAKNLDEIQGILFQRENGGEYIGGWSEEILDVEDTPDAEDTPNIEEATGVEGRFPILMERIASEEAQEQQEEESGSEPEEYIQPRNVTYEKIERKDISRLPRKEWRLANNSFLLHGFYNYHHLLYIEEDGEVWIGVPGIYHQKEKMAANAFGFTDFRRMTDVEIDLEENEKNTYEDFGYWCRQILRT